MNEHSETFHESQAPENSSPPQEGHAESHVERESSTKSTESPSQDTIPNGVPEAQAEMENGEGGEKTEDKLDEQKIQRKDSSTTQESSRAVKSRAASIDQSEKTLKDAATKPLSKPSRFPNFSASLPSVPWGGQSKTGPAARSPSPQPLSKETIPVTRRNTPFGWLSRATTGSKDLKSPPLPPKPIPGPRRGTTTSMSTSASGNDLTWRAIEDDTGNGKSARNSLKERFKLLRLREEAGITDLNDTEQVEDGSARSRAGSLVINTASPQDLQNDSSFSSMKSPQLPLLSPVPMVNENLAPGTVSGFSVAVEDSAAPIDWDFWQTVVNEGPTAVSRTSPEELTAAISSGIPATIRGVIWQVLAGSKHEDLEVVYNELKLRGTKDEIKTSSPTVLSSQQNENKEKDSTMSSRSSVRSDHSTPATSANVGIASPSPSQENPDPIKDTKLQAQTEADRAKRIKDDAAAIAKLEKMIRRDMGSRTSYSKYTAAAGFQDGLFNVCKAYALFDDAVGYPQGMNFIVMPLLFTMPEEEAFCLLVRLMNKYQLRELFVNDMPGLHLHLYQFERLLEDLEPALYCHLNRRGVPPRLYATQWFLTLFAYRLPLQLVMRVYDLILCEGLEGAILKFGIALMQKNVDTLLSMNEMQTLTTYLKEKLFDVYIDQAPSSKSILESGFFGSSGGSENEVYRADLLVQDACSVKLSAEMLARYTTEYEEKTTAEKARETELENLRTDSITKAAQIKSLEQRAEKSDTEHVEIANELVRLKVENQDLIDENESLKGQVEELRKVAESEAANVEAKMQATTEKVMQRNIEVQNENRHMEEQMAEMEKELVDMKIKHAQVSRRLGLAICDRQH